MVTTTVTPDRDWTTGEPVILVSRCRSCAHRWYISRDACPACGSPDVVTVPAAGTGQVVAHTTVHRVAAGAVDEPGPVGIALVDLDEGVRVMGRCAPETVVGSPVRVVFLIRPGESDQPVLLPFFEAAGP
jgi:uncharacterized OB-fold protein